MSYAKRRDRNHAEIRDGLRKRGVDVLDLGNAGNGVPDLGAIHAVTLLGIFIEVKDWKKPPSARELTPAEQEFASYFPVVVVTTLEEALRACGVDQCP